MNIEKVKASTQFLKLEEVKNLVIRAKNYEQSAIDALCKAYKPLIESEINKSYVADTLGEDAENTAWRIFLEFIYLYDKEDYRCFGSLLKKYLHFELLHTAIPRTRISVYADLLLDIVDENGNRIYEPVAPCNPFICESQDDKFIGKCLDKLIRRQRDVIEATIIGSQSLKEYCQERGISFSTAFISQQRALKKLNKLIAKNKLHIDN